TQQLVRLVLNRTGVDRRFDRETLESFGKMKRPEDGQVGLGCRTKIVERVQHTERSFGYESATVFSHSANHFGHPHRVPGKELVILGSAEKAHETPLDHQ